MSFVKSNVPKYVAKNLEIFKKRNVDQLEPDICDIIIDTSNEISWVWGHQISSSLFCAIKTACKVTSYLEILQDRT